jgi:hypothetical protein
VTIHSSKLVPKFKFFEPERNLPGRKPHGRTEEARFALKFAQTYLRSHTAIHHKTKKRNIVCARQVAVNGFGIADIVAVSWDSNKQLSENLLTIDKFIKIYSPTVRAFEIKLNNWRKGITQTHRYRYFANSAILVLPYSKITLALKYLDTFKAIHVGLWSFDFYTQRIVTYYTPRPSTPLTNKYTKRVIQSLAKTTKEALPIL